jgi:hypothetical protein
MDNSNPDQVIDRDEMEMAWVKTLCGLHETWVEGEGRRLSSGKQKNSLMLAITQVRHLSLSIPDLSADEHF